MAGSSVTVTKRSIENNSEHIDEYAVAWVGDDATGAVPVTEIVLSGALAHDKPIYGWVFLAETDPGAGVPPTDNYDIEILNAQGVDIFGAELINRSQTLTQRVTPKVGAAYGEAFSCSILRFSLANNSVNSATGTLRLYVRRMHRTAGNLGRGFTVE